MNPNGKTIGRNERCHCGSGKKYKRCHLDSDKRQPSHADQATPTTAAPPQLPPAGVVDGIRPPPTPDVSLKPKLVEVACGNVLNGCPFDWDSLESEVSALRSPDATRPEDLAELIDLVRGLLDGSKEPFMFSGAGPVRGRFTCVEQRPPDSDHWFVGDVHGDLLSFRTLLAYARNHSSSNGRQAKFVFLGDFFDDGAFGHRVLFEFLGMAARDRLSTAFVVGNHDIALTFDVASDKFVSNVSPSDFATWLNEQPSDSKWRGLARVAIDFFAEAPCALLLTNGVLVSHGGIPHTDRIELLNSAEDLIRDDFLEDFVWTRASETSKRKIPNRSSRGCQYGFLDFQDFCARAEGVLKRPIQGLVRGHDHVPERWQFPEKYKPRWLLTLNAMSSAQRDAFGPFERRPVIARMVDDGPPEIHRIEIPPKLIRSLNSGPSDVEAGGV